MSDTANETRLRACLTKMVNEIDRFSLTDDTKEEARKLIAETEPRHPAEVLWEELVANPNIGLRTMPQIRNAAMHFYKAGMLAAGEMLHPLDWQVNKHRIREQAEKVPV